VARTVEPKLKRVPGTREVQTIGGPGRAVMCGSTRCACVSAASMLRLKATLAAANLGMPSGACSTRRQGAADAEVETGEFLRSADEVGDAGGGVSGGKPVYLREVAEGRSRRAIAAALCLAVSLPTATASPVGRARSTRP
jgi:multidrug efflux pump subunit AcrB